MTKTRCEFTTDILKIEEEQKALRKKFDDDLKHLKGKKLLAQRGLSLLDRGMDLKQVAIGMDALQIRGTFERGGDARESVVKGAIKELTEGGGILFRDYFGTKSYDRWHGQRSDHEYGFGPKHGSIIFSIGLSASVLKAGSMTSEQVDAALYVLQHLSSIQSAYSEAA